MVDSNPTLKTPDMDSTPKLEAGGHPSGAAVPVAKLTEAALCEWIATALVASRSKYHEGYLMVDRFGSSSGRCALERHRLLRSLVACGLLASWASFTSLAKKSAAATTSTLRCDRQAR